jgi:hypothetical protein
MLIGSPPRLFAAGTVGFSVFILKDNKNIFTIAMVNTLIWLIPCS